MTHVLQPGVIAYSATYGFLFEVDRLMETNPPMVTAIPGTVVSVESGELIAYARRISQSVERNCRIATKDEVLLYEDAHAV
jgi:hypothetical protein